MPRFRQGHGSEKRTLRWSGGVGLFPAQDGVGGLGEGGVGFVLLATLGLLLVSDLVADSFVEAVGFAPLLFLYFANLVTDMVFDVLLLLRLVLVVRFLAHGGLPFEAAATVFPCRSINCHSFCDRSSGFFSSPP